MRAIVPLAAFRDLQTYSALLGSAYRAPVPVPAMFANTWGSNERQQERKRMTYLLHRTRHTDFSVVRACKNFRMSLVYMTCSVFFVGRARTTIYHHI